VVNHESNNYKLDWVSPVTISSVELLITETLKLTNLVSHALVPGQCITVELTGDNAVFQSSESSDSNAHCDSAENPKRWSHRTDILGRTYPVIKSLENIDSEVTLSAYLTDNPAVKAQPLTLTMTSVRKVKAVKVTPKHSRQHVNVRSGIVATVLDMNDAPYPDQTVYFSADNDAKLLMSSGITDGFGQTSVDVVGVKPGQVTVIATIDKQSDSGIIDFEK